MRKVNKKIYKEFGKDKEFWKGINKEQRKSYETYFKIKDGLKKVHPPGTYLGFVDGELKSIGMDVTKVIEETRSQAVEQKKVLIIPLYADRVIRA